MTRSSCASQLTRTLIRAAIDSSLPRARCATIPCTRSFTSSSSHHDAADDRKKLLSNYLSDPKTTTSTGLAPTPPPTRGAPMKDLVKALSAADLQPPVMENTVMKAMGMATNSPRFVQAGSILREDEENPLTGLRSGVDADDYSRDPEPFHFHVFSHRHNTYVTVTKPNRNPIISVSCGALGFRHANRGQYDAAYQLGAYAIDKIQQAGWHAKIHKLEVVLRGFGPGREAVTKVLLSNEGRLLRDKICKVSDSTRLKFGGTRSEKPRRL